jgi:hypothetical protein
MKRTGKLRRPPQNTPRLSGTQVQGISLGQRVCAHYFLPGADCHWYVLEYSKDLDLMFGWIEFAGRIGEFGYTSLKELELIVGKVSFSPEGEEALCLETVVEYDKHLGSMMLGDCLRRQGQTRCEMWVIR